MEKNPYENPAVFEVRTPKKYSEKVEDLRQGILLEQDKKKPWLKKYFFVVVAAAILITFAFLIIVFKVIS